MVNISILNTTISLKTYNPEFKYVDWCIDQQVHFQSSINQSMLFFIGLAWLFLILASYTFKFKKYNKFHESMLHMARLSLVLVIASWFLFVYLGIIWFE